MNLLDMRTVFTGFFFSDLLCTLVLLRFWRFYRRQFHGTTLWLAGFTLQTLSMLLIALRGVIPDPLSVITGNLMALAGFMLIFTGLERFLDTPGPKAQNIILLAVFAAGHAFFTLVRPSLAARNINISIGLILVSLQAVWLLHRRVPLTLRPLVNGVGSIYIGYCLASAARIANSLLQPAGEDFMRSGLAETVVLLLYQMLTIALTFGLILMVNRRLSSAMVHDLDERRRTEEALRESEELYRRLVENAIVGIGVSSGNKVVFANRALLDIFGYETIEELAAVPLIEHVAPNSRALIEERMTKAARGDAVTPLFEYNILRRDLSRRTLLATSNHFTRDGKTYTQTVFQDITERRRAEKNLRVDEAKLANAVKIADLGYWEYDLAEDRFLFDDQCYSVFRTTALRAGGYSVASNEFADRFLQTEDRYLIADEIRQAASAVGVDYGRNLEFRILQDDGEVGHVAARYFIVKDEQGSAVKGYGIVQNITERKKIEEALRMVSARYRAILSSVPDIIMEVDENRLYTWANRAGFEFFGDDVLGREAAHYFIGEQKTYETVEPIFQGDENVVYVESWQRRRDGESRLLAWWCRVLKDQGGRVKGALSTARDITAQKTAEEKLREVEERFRFTIEAVNVGLFDWDIQGGRVYYSPAFKKLLGEEEVPPEYESWEARLHPEDRASVLQTLEEHLAGRTEDWLCDHRLRKRDDEWIWVVGRGRVTARDGHGRALRMVGTMVDISERKKAERALVERERDLRELSGRLIRIREEERNRIARNIHDDLGHTVMAVKMNLFMADLALQGGQAPAREILKEMKSQVDTLLESIQRISMEIRPAVLYDLGLVEALRFYVRRFEEQTEIKCAINTPAGIPALPDETAISVYRIVQEVFVNMFRHAECSEIRLDLSLEADRCVLAVGDNGKGIAREKLDSLDSLGLIGMRERALSLGGELAIEGRPGEGTTVRLTFPLPAEG